MQYAIVGNNKQEAKPGLKGVCPCCKSPVIPKCGAWKVHHWAHKSRRDCDSWSEPVGPWHLSWQSIVNAKFVEVVIEPHRADILGDCDTVIELQHSTIGKDEIRERETFYENMIWVFDATGRFECVHSGNRCFFSLKRTKHIQQCEKPVFLDFPTHLVQVERFTKDKLDKLSGYGLIRNREWFVNEYLHDHRQSGPLPPPYVNPNRRDDPVWRLLECPSKSMKHGTYWIQDDELIEYPRGTTYLPMDYNWKLKGEDREWPVWLDVIEQMSEIANGWECKELRAMIGFLGGKPMIIGGLLRLMPKAASEINVTTTQDETESLLDRVDRHIQEGRIPRIKESTRQTLLSRATEFEAKQHPLFAQQRS